MSERGFIAVDRGVWDHELFVNDVFSWREAWLWLISEAAWKPKSIKTDSGKLQLERGQLVTSSRLLAARWNWSKSSAHRFLSRLQTEKMVEMGVGHKAGQQLGQGLTVITICKYNEYNKSSDQFGTQTGTQSGTESNKSLNNQNKRKKDSAPRARPAPDQKSLLLPIDGGRKKSTPHTLPRDYELTQARRDIAIGCGLDPKVTFQKFTEHFWMTGRRLVEWDTRWGQWCSEQRTRVGGPVAASLGRAADPKYGNDYW
jgi:hypothetical protein